MLAQDSPVVAMDGVDAVDIGRAAAVIVDPGSLAGETVTLAGDELSLTRTAAVVPEYLGTD